MTAETSNARGEWLQSGGLLYRLTDERRPQNCDEINVTMAAGSRDDAARAARAAEILAMLAAAPPPAAARGDVRGLVADRQAWFESEIAKAERQWIDGFHDRYEAGDDVPSMDHFVALWLAERTEALAADGTQAGEVDGELSHADLCRLSRVFNDHNELRLTQDRRINEWLGKRITESLTGERNG